MGGNAGRFLLGPGDDLFSFNLGFPQSVCPQVLTHLVDLIHDLLDVPAEVVLGLFLQSLSLFGGIGLYLCSFRSALLQDDLYLLGGGVRDIGSCLFQDAVGFHSGSFNDLSSFLLCFFAGVRSEFLALLLDLVQHLLHVDRYAARGFRHRDSGLYRSL